MEMNDQGNKLDDCRECNEVVATKKPAKKEKKKLSTDEKIYNFLDAAERLARFIANRQKAKKKKAKKQLKKTKKAYKIDKKTGALLLKRIKRDKVQKPMKRYKPKKKK